MEKCFYSGRRNAVIMKQDMGGRNMKKRSRILALILTAMLATEPVQIVYAETAEATPVTSESTSVNPKEENASCSTES